MIIGMKKIVRLKESDLHRIVKRVIRESEEDWASSSEELDNETNFGEMSIENNPDFQKLVTIFQNNPEIASELSDNLDSMNEDYEYSDYTDAQPKKISKGEYWKRKMSTVGLTSLVGLVSGIAMAGGISAEDVLQMALGTALGGGVIGNTLVSNVHRKKTNETMLSELGGMDDGHPVLGDLNFGNLSPEERERVNKYYRVSDEDVNDEYEASPSGTWAWFDPRMQEHPAGGKYVSSDGWWPDHNNPKYSSEWEDFEFDDFTELKRSRIPNDSFRELRTRRDFDKLRNPETGKVHIRRNPNTWNNYQSGRHYKR